MLKVIEVIGLVIVLLIGAIIPLVLCDWVSNAIDTGYERDLAELLRRRREERRRNRELLIETMIETTETKAMNMNTTLHFEQFTQAALMIMMLHELSIFLAEHYPACALVITPSDCALYESLRVGHGEGSPHRYVQ